jgi:hypothetical protein
VRVDVVVKVGVDVLVGGTIISVSVGVMVNVGAGEDVSVAVSSLTTAVVLNAVDSGGSGWQARKRSDEARRRQVIGMYLILFFPNQLKVRRRA